MITNNTQMRNIQIPAHMVAQVEQMLETMNVQLPWEVEQTPENIQEEVKQVLKHHIVDGEWWFELKFKSGETQLVNDKDCDCETLISNYLHTKNISTVYVVCRVSTKEQATSTNVSLDAQAEEICTVLKNTKSRVKIVKISASAYRDIPKELQEIGSCVTATDSIYIWRVDRLSRNIFKYLYWLEDLDKRNVEIYAVDNGLYYNSNKTDFIQAVLDAQKEAEILGARVRLANKRKLQRGDEALGSLPYGKQYYHLFDKDGNTVRKIVVDNLHEQNLINKIITTPVLDPVLIAQTLNNQKLFKRGRKWSKQMVQSIIKKK
jgi:DNA invertase Pin-like site-specific DNA recombinase